MNAQQLKNSILQQAIEGRLVPQDPNDEPASVLLERIRTEKKRLVKEKKIKADKNESRIYRTEEGHWIEHFEDKKLKDVCIDDEIPFELPKGWEWVRWGMLGDYKKGPFGSSLTKSMFVPKSSNAIKVYEQKNAIQKNFSLGDYFISEEKYETMKGFTVNPGDIIISCAGTIGETYLLPKDAPIGIINQALMRARLHIDSIIPYWILNFRYILVIENKLKGAGSAIKNIPPFELLKAMLIPLPPLSEQHRIVAKIEELMPLVEEYGKAQDALDKLNKELPEKLKKSILQEAIEGRLVPQDPNDEPASVLLERIRKEKKKLVKEGKLKKKDLEETPISEDEKPFDIPEGWEWCRLFDVSNVLMGQSPDGNDVFEAAHDDKAYEFHQGKINFTEKYIAPSGKWCKKPSRVAESGSLLVCVRAPIGDVNITLRDIGIGRGLAAINGWSNIRTEFLYYWMIAHKKSLVDKGTGSTFKAITIDVLRNQIIPLPPLSEQHRIVAKIQELFKEIEQLKQ